MRPDFNPEIERTHETKPVEASEPDSGVMSEMGGLAVAMASASDPGPSVGGSTTSRSHSIGSLAASLGRGGGVSLQDTIAQVAALQQSVKDQIRMINDFLSSNADTMQLVHAELKGSTKGYDQQMVASLSQVESSLKASLTSLDQASTALDRVRAI